MKSESVINYQHIDQYWQIQHNTLTPGKGPQNPDKKVHNSCLPQVVLSPGYGPECHSEHRKYSTDS